MSELSSYESFSIEVKDHIAHVQFSRPEALNTMNKAFWLELPRCMQDIEANTDNTAAIAEFLDDGSNFY